MTRTVLGVMMNKTLVWFAFLQIFSIWVLNDSLESSVTPRYMALLSVWRVCPWMELMMFFFFWVNPSILHSSGLNSIGHSTSQS